MPESFGSFLNTLLREHRLTQQGLIEWLFVNQSQNPPRFNTPNAIKESLRTLRHNASSSVSYELIQDIARFFEEFRRPATASRLRHIYLQQSYDKNQTAGLHANVSPVSKSIEWLVFPDPDRGPVELHIQEWKDQLRNGNRAVLRESISFYYDYKDSYVHSPLRQRIAIDLAREAISNGEYLEGYIVAHSYAQSWERYFSTRSEERAPWETTYRPMLRDIFDYLTALQIRAAAASHVYYYAPGAASINLFMQALSTLHRMRPVFGRHVDSFMALVVQWHVRFLRMLCRSFVGFAPEARIDPPPQRRRHETDLGQVRDRMRTALATLERLTTSQAAWQGGSYVSRFMVLDTIARTRALLASSEAEIDAAQDVLRRLPEAETFDSQLQNAMTRYRTAATDAIFVASRYRVALLAHEWGRADELESEVVDRIRSIIDTVPTPRQYHIQAAVRMLVTYVHLVRGSPDRSAQGEQRTSSQTLPNIFQMNRNPSKISEELDLSTARAKDVGGVLFAVNPDDPEHLEGLRQANALRRNWDAIELL